MNLDSSVDLEKLSDLTIGFSGADLHALLHDAQLLIIQDSFSGIDLTTTFESSNVAFESSDPLSHSESKDIEKIVSRLHPQKTSTHSVPALNTSITQAHLSQALSTMKPSLAEKQVSKLRRIYESFSNGKIDVKVGQYTAFSS